MPSLCCLFSIVYAFLSPRMPVPLKKTIVKILLLLYCHPQKVSSLWIILDTPRLSVLSCDSLAAPQISRWSPRLSYIAHDGEIWRREGKRNRPREAEEKLCKLWSWFCLPFQSISVWNRVGWDVGCSYGDGWWGDQVSWMGSLVRVFTVLYLIPVFKTYTYICAYTHTHIYILIMGGEGER